MYKYFELHLLVPQPFDRAIGFCLTCTVAAASNCSHRRHGEIRLHLQNRAASHEHWTAAFYRLRDRATVYLVDKVHCEFVTLNCLNLLRPDQENGSHVERVFKIKG